MDRYTHAARIVRSSDRDRYLADLLAPASARRHLLVLHAFNVEVARIRQMTSEPTLGEMRLQFWHDAIHGDGAGHPLAQLLIETIEKFSLPLAAFDNLLEARRFDLYNDPMPSLNDLEGYAGETSSSLIQLAAIIIAGDRASQSAEIAGHGGVAYALTGIVTSLPIHSARGQCYLPADFLSRHRVDRDSVLAGKSSPALIAALGEFKSIAAKHVARVRTLCRDLDPAIFPALLPVALVEPQLAAMDRKSFDPFSQMSELSPLRRQWILWRTAKRGVI